MAIQKKEKPTYRLGAWEKKILELLAIHGVRGKWYEPDLCRDELPGLLFGWEGTKFYFNGYHYTYPNIEKKELNKGQATLSRALQTLYQKGLIQCGSTYHVEGLKIYSKHRAKKLGIMPTKPLTDADLDTVHYSEDGRRKWTHRSSGCKPMDGRNIKGIKLTDIGREKVKHSAFKQDV